MLFDASVISHLEYSEFLSTKSVFDASFGETDELCFEVSIFSSEYQVFKCVKKSKNISIKQLTEYEVLTYDF